MSVPGQVDGLWDCRSIPRSECPGLPRPPGAGWLSPVSEL